MPLFLIEQNSATDTPELEVMKADTDIEVISPDAGETIIRE